MNFKLFIFYCSICGGWAAFLAWGLTFLTGPGHPVTQDRMGVFARASITGLFLGCLVAAAVGLVDAILNSVGFARVKRTLVCAAVGLVGGLLGGLLGQALNNAGMPLFFGWIIVGVFIGASIGIYDIISAAMTKGDMRVPLKRTLNGIYGGFLGGFAGGLPFEFIMKMGASEEGALIGWDKPLALSKLAIGLVILGLLIGCLIALAQVFLKESWVTIESGRRAGKQMMLAKDETVIGRAEGIDIGLYGEQGIERQHAKIVLKNNKYYLEDNNTPGGTFLNDQRIDGRVALKNGDKIQVGTAVLRFGERAKK
jgi:hypothetical protein